MTTCVCDVFYVRLDTSKSRASPHHSPTTTATAAASVDRCGPGDRPSSARATFSPARCPGSTKYTSPASGKSSPAGSPLTDGSRRRRTADHRNSPRHAAYSSVGGISSSQLSANRHSVRSDGVQSASSSAVMGSRLKPTMSVEHAAVHSETHPAVLAGGSEAQLKSCSHRRIAGVQCTNGSDSNGNNSQQRLTGPSTTSAAVTSPADHVKRRCDRCKEQPCTCKDTNSTAQVQFFVTMLY